ARHAGAARGPPGRRPGAPGGPHGLDAAGRAAPLRGAAGAARAMSERREYFRVRALARVRLRAVDKAQAEALRHALYARASRGSAEERARESEFPEQRALLDGLRQISLALERIERRLERLELGGAGAASPSEPVEISLSGAGFAGPFELE